MNNIGRDKRKIKKVKQKNNHLQAVTAKQRTTRTQKHENPGIALAAKDSEWIDILQTRPNDVRPSSSGNNTENAPIQNEGSETGFEIKPLTTMFPSLLKSDPQILERILNRWMSTTDVTRHLVDLGEKANFDFIKKSHKLIPPDKIRLERLPECSDSEHSSQASIKT